MRQHAGPSGTWGPNDEEVDEMKCDPTHSYLSREHLSKLPSSTSSIDTWVDEVRSKGKGTSCPSCGECAKDCSCRRQISSLEDRVKELKKAAKEKKRDDDSKWKEMEQKLEKLTNLVRILSTTGLTGPAPTMASHPAPTEAVGWGPAALALEDPENATEHKNQASTMTPVSGVIFSISIAFGVHLTTFYTNLSRIFAAWQD